MQPVVGGEGDADGDEPENTADDGEGQETVARRLTGSVGHLRLSFKKKQMVEITPSRHKKNKEGVSLFLV